MYRVYLSGTGLYLSIDLSFVLNLCSIRTNIVGGNGLFYGRHFNRQSILRFAILLLAQKAKSRKREETINEREEPRLIAILFNFQKMGFE